MTDHGDIRTYRRGCKCVPCKAASARYRAELRRASAACVYPDPAERVPAAAAELRLAELRARGVGYRQVARLAGLSDRFVIEVRTGKVATVRADTMTRILAVPFALAHGQHVMGWRTARLVDSLTREGFSKARIAHSLGRRSRSLQIGRRKCTVKNALRVRRLWDRVNQEGAYDTQ